LLSQPESNGLRQVFAGSGIYPHLLSPPIYIHSQRMWCQRPCCLTDGVFACLSGACGSTRLFFEIASSRAGKAAGWWVKHRLWDWLFEGANLRQQGSPTIFGVWRSPTISRISTRCRRQSGLVARPAGRFAVPESTHFFARKP
jgi:hypothetical protein